MVADKKKWVISTHRSDMILIISYDRTTGLVIFMTSTSFIALLPSGVMTSLKAVYTDVGFM